MKENKFLSNFMFHRLKISLINKNILSKNEAKEIVKMARPITSSLIGRLENLSDKNPLSPNVQLAFPIIGVWLASNKTITLEKIESAISGALDSRLVKLFYSAYNFNDDKSAKKFLSMMKKYSAWHESHKDVDANGWKYSFNDDLHKKGCYYAFKFCPIADFCIKNGYKEIAPILCSIDYTTFKMCHGNLIRNKTLAKGDDMCDFWIVGDKEEKIE